MAHSLDFDSDVFSCEQKGQAAVLHLKRGAFDLLTDLDARAADFAVMTQIEEAEDVAGLVILNTDQFPGEEEYRAFLQKVSAIDERSVEGRRLMLSLKENSLAAFALQAATFRKPIVAGLQGTITGAFLGVSLAYDFRVAAEDTVFEFPAASIGFPLGGALCHYLPQFVGRQRATEILLTGSSDRGRPGAAGQVRQRGRPGRWAGGALPGDHRAGLGASVGCRRGDPHAAASRPG